MSNKSISAVTEFKDVLNENGVFTRALSTEVFQTRVIVKDYKDEKIFDFGSMKVKLSDCNIYVNVEIMWEDCGLCNYKKHNLYGYYSTGYCKMEYIDDNKEFIIYSEDNKIIIEVPQ